MNQTCFPFSLEEVRLLSATYIDQQYAQNHAHALHQHRDKIELLYVCSGNGRYRIDRREYAVHEGDMLICNAYTLHGETLSLGNSIQTYCCALSNLNVSGLPENNLISAEQYPIVRLTQYKNLIHGMMPQIYALLAEQKKDVLAEQMAKTVLAMTFREMNRQEVDNNSQTRQRINALICNITEYLDRYYTEPMLRMADICGALNISESYLFHLFKQETGLSPKQYIILRRIGEAQSLLEVTEIPIREIEEKLGFGSSCHLTATFKKYVGLSPREYRRHFREKNSTTK